MRMLETNMNGITQRLCSGTSFLYTSVHLSMPLIPHVLMLSVTYFLNKKEKIKKSCADHQNQETKQQRGVQIAALRQGFGLINLKTILEYLSHDDIAKILSTLPMKSVDLDQCISKGSLSDLPDDVIANIVVKLPIKSVRHVQCASKSFCKMVVCPSFATLVEKHRVLTSGTFIDINSGSGGFFEVPQLMLLTRSKQQCGRFLTAFKSVERNGVYGLRETKHGAFVSKVFTGSDCFELDFVFRDLFCFKSGFRCFLVNPCRGEILKLPRKAIIPMASNIIFRGGQEMAVDVCYGMGIDDTTSTFKIVRVAATKGANNFKAVAQVCVLGCPSLSWRKIESVPGCGLSHKNASAYGDMHWLIRRDNSSYDDRIVSFDFKKEKFHWTSQPNLMGFSLGWYDDIHLVNIKGSLAIVDLSFSRGPEIWVMKDYHTKSWELAYSIDNPISRAHAESSYYGASTVLCCGEWEYGMFFREKEDPNVYYYLDTRCDSVKQVKIETLPIPKIMRSIFSGAPSMDSMIYSYTRSVISMKNFGTLEAPNAGGTWDIM